MKIAPTTSPKTPWTPDRVARLGFLIGQGWDAKRVARDPLIASTANNVHRQASRFGLGFRDAPIAACRLPGETGVLYDAAAAKRGLSRDGLIRMVLLAAASDASLIDNILDDGL